MAKELNSDNKQLMVMPMEDVMHNSMIPYAEYVIMDRALPRVEDGLKPVQRRILYTMIEQGLTPDKPYRKSARIVGDCLGKYHPHGDRSVYDAMVRMAQPFNMRMTLVSGHGNYGSVDGDSAAAMRYTEARLEPLALELLRDIEKDTVKWNLNYDDTRQEPDMLPGRFPNLLVNGATGIAVGLATNIPPHNLGEVIDGVIAMIDNPKITLQQLMKIIKGPDFPTGGFLFSEELEQAYETGRGKLMMRARMNIENDENGKKNIVITEIPYQVNKANLLKRILTLREEKKDLLSGISEIRDESDRNGMRAVIKVKRDADVKQILNILFKSTDLECSYGVNMVAIAGGKPQQMGVISILTYYIEYQRNVILRRSKYDLARAKEREHILEGLLIAIKNIDEVIKIIKSSASTTEAKASLRARFELSDRQAQAILDMRLARLTNLEVYKIEAELKELKALIEKLTEIIASKKLQMEVVKDELREIKKTYKTPRLTTIVSKIENAVIPSDDDEKVVDDIAVVCNLQGTMKCVPAKNFSMASKELGEKFSANDIAPLIIETQSNCSVYAFTNLGNCYKLDIDALPECRWKERGILFKNIAKDAKDGEKVVCIYPIAEKMPNTDIVFFTKMGMVKRSKWEEMNVVKSNFQAVKLKDDDEVISVDIFDKEKTMMFVTKNGMGLNADVSDIPAQGRIASGVRGVSLSDDDCVIFAGFIYKEGEIVIITDKGAMKRIISANLEVTSRYRKGVKIIELKDNKSSCVSYASYVTEPYQIAIMDKDGALYAIDTESIPIDSRTSKGKFIKQYKNGFDVKDIVRHRVSGEYITLKNKKKK